MKKRNKTLVFFNGFYIPHLGGVERYTNKLIEELKKNYKIIIVTSNDNNYKNYEMIDGIEIYRLPVYNFLKNRLPFIKKNKEYYNLLKKIKSQNIDYIICNTRFYNTSLLGAKISKYKNCPLFFIEHSSNHVTIGNKLIDYFVAIYEHIMTNKIKKYNPKFYGVSKKCNEWLKHYNINSNGVFYNSIDDKIYKKFYKKRTEHKTIISYIGRIIPEKGIVNLLEAFLGINNKYNNLELNIAGDGPILEELKKSYQQKNIKFLGKLNYEEVMELCVKTDIFIHPSMYPEGLPTSILEAGLMKCAVIATDRGGTTEVVLNGKTGLIIEENIEDLKNKLSYLLDNPKIQEEFKENIHNHIINNFTWKSTAKIFVKEIEKNGKQQN